MNIRDYYQKTAKACFIVAWISLILAILFFMSHILRLFPKEILTLAIPLILFSVIHFIYFRIYDNRVNKLEHKSIETSGELFSTEDVLVVFMPAPTLRLLLFNSDGFLLGEIRDQNMRWFMWLIPNFLSILLPKKFELVNHQGNLLAKYHLTGGLRNSMTIYNVEHEIIGFYQEEWKQSWFKIKGKLYNKERTEWIAIQSKPQLYSLQLESVDGKKVAFFQEGWMPVEWEKIFEVNTPIITFSSFINEEERMIVLGFFAAVLHHQDN
jgi:hypothetical protein